MTAPSFTLMYEQVFVGAKPRAAASSPYLSIPQLSHPVTYFVGRNGSGKSKAARAIANQYGARLLSTDRLFGLMSANNYGWTMVPNQSSYKGLPVGTSERDQARGFGQQGTAVDELYHLREQPDVWIRVAAFIRRTLGRVVELRDSSGYIDPFVRVGASEYSLLRDEGHGLRELVVLLAAIYRSDWPILIVDEPESHLHPSIARIWLSELERVCSETNRHAIVVTHEPTAIRPTSCGDLGAIWHFQVGRDPVQISSAVLTQQESRVTASLQYNPTLLSTLLFSPRPVLLEGPHDFAAMSTALARTQPPEVILQTDLVECGGSGGVTLWYEIARKLDLDVRGVADLDALFSTECQRSMDAPNGLQAVYRDQFGAQPPTTSEILRPILNRMGQDGVGNDPASRRAWLVALPNDPPDGHVALRDRLLQALRDGGMWLHAEGTLEDVLGLSDKSADQARMAAERPGPIDTVVEWCAYRLDMAGDIFALLGAYVESIAHRIMEAQRLTPEQEFHAPAGPTAENDQKIVDVEPVGQGRHRLTVRLPTQFSGWWLEFDRGTPSADLRLNPPDED